MDNLIFNTLNGYQTNPIYSNRNNISYSRSGEPVSVNGMGSVNAFQTLPNTRTVLFHSSEPIFYCKVTDDNNYPNIKVYRYTEIKPTSQESQFVTIEEFNKFKEDILNGQQQHIWNKSNDEPAGTPNPASATTNEYIGSKSEPNTDVAESSEPESPIW